MELSVAESGSPACIEMAQIGARVAAADGAIAGGVGRVLVFGDIVCS